MEYVRPVIPEPLYTDAQGEVIPYGQRWHRDGQSGPPDWAYSHEDHPERFLPLFDVAASIAEHLESAYDVEVQRERDSWEFLPAGSGMPITIRFDRPNICVHVRTGNFGQRAFPLCGCDACDDDLLQVVSDLEQNIDEAVRGSVQEQVSGSWLVVTTPTHGYRSRVKRSERRRYRRVQRAAPDSWLPWRPRRTDVAT